MNPLLFTTIVIIMISVPSYAQSEKLVLLTPQESDVTEKEVRSVNNQESVKHDDGGYLENDTVVKCFAAMSYRYTGGRYVNEEIRFRIHSPSEVKAGKKYPLLIWLHGKGESGDDNRRQLAHMQSTIDLFAGKNQIDFYLLATQCPKDNEFWETSVSDEGKGDAPLTIMKEILDILLEEYPIDRNRISFYGQCSGATGAFYFLEKYPELVAAIAAFSTIPPYGFHWDARYGKTSFWAFNNLDDAEVPVKPMEQFVQQIVDSGGLGYMTVRKYGGHDTWSLGMKKTRL